MSFMKSANWDEWTREIKRMYVEPEPCPECEDYDREHDHHCPLHPDYDPTPYCTVCGDGSGICCTNPQARND